MEDNIEEQLIRLITLNRKYLDLNLNISNPKLQIIYNELERFYKEKGNIESCSKETITSILRQIYKGKQQEILKNTIEEIYSIELDTSYILEYLIPTITYNNLKSEVYSILEETQQTPDSLSSLIDKLDHITDRAKNQAEPETADFAELSLDKYLENQIGYNWATESLQNYLGPLTPSTFGVVVAPVEAGKTAFVIDSSINWRNQGAKILHINNEDPINKLLEKYYMREFRKTKIEILLESNKYTEKFKNKHSKSLFILDSAEISLLSLSGLIKKLQPDIVIIDQIDPMTNDIDPSSLELLYKSIRKIAKENRTRIIGVTQASDCDGPYITLRDMHNSKVGKQAALDYMIGIGILDGAETKRYISIPKNKLTGERPKFVLGFNRKYMEYYDFKE